MHLDPRTKLTATIGVSILAVCLDHPLSLAILTAVCALCFFIATPDLKQAKLVIGFTLLTCWGIVISQGIFYQSYPRTVLFILLPRFHIAGIQLGGLYIYVQGLFYGLVQSLRFASCMLAGIALCMSTPADEIFAGLIAIRIPYTLSFLATVAIRFLPTFANEIENVRASMRLKGYKPFKKGLVHTINTELGSVLPIMAGAIRRSRDVADALLSRGFDPLAQRTLYNRLCWPSWEKGITTVILALASGTAILRIMFWLYENGMYYSSNLRGIYSFVRFYL